MGWERRIPTLKDSALRRLLQKSHGQRITHSPVYTSISKEGYQHKTMTGLHQSIQLGHKQALTGPRPSISPFSWRITVNS